MASQTTTFIYFDGQFWIGLIERLDDGRYSAARHIFGPEPTNAQLLIWAAEGFAALRFSAGRTVGNLAPLEGTNPKRLKRQAARSPRPETSRAEEAIKADLALRKNSLKPGAASQLAQEDQFRLRRQKAKDRQRGR